MIKQLKLLGTSLSSQKHVLITEIILQVNVDLESFRNHFKGRKGYIFQMCHNLQITESAFVINDFHKLLDQIT